MNVMKQQKSPSVRKGGSFSSKGIITVMILAMVVRTTSVRVELQSQHPVIVPTENFVLTSLCDTSEGTTDPSSLVIGPLVSTMSQYLECDTLQGVRVSEQFFSDKKKSPSSVAPDGGTNSMDSSVAASYPKQVSYFLQSTNHLDRLIQLYQNNPQDQNGSYHYDDGFSISIWFRPALPSGGEKNETDNDFDETIEPILTLGLPYPLTTTNHLEDDELFYDYDGCTGLDIFVAQYHGRVYLAYRDNDPARTCRKVYFRDHLLFDDDHDDGENPTPTQGGGRMTHFVVEWNMIRQQTNIYINGQPFVLGAPNDIESLASSGWDSSSTIQLFRNQQSREKETFQGAIYQVSLFLQALGRDQVSRLYEKGVEIAPLVLNAPLPMTNFSVPQDEKQPNVLRLTMNDTIITSAKLAVEIVSLPGRGKLSSPGTPNHELGLKSLVIIDNVFGDRRKPSVDLEYSLFPDSNDYFSVPTIDARGINLELKPDSFKFRFVALDTSQGSAKVVGASDEAAQLIQIVHVNHKPTLVAPQQAATLEELGLDPEYYFNNGFLINDIILSDSRDLNMNFARVDLTANVGYLTLNPIHRDLAVGAENKQFAACCVRDFSAWQCKATKEGVRERHITFVAIPDDVNLILKDLLYEAPQSGSAEEHLPDEVTIQVYDGEGGNCLTERERPKFYGMFGNEFSTIHRNCWELEATIRIPSLHEATPTPGESNENAPASREKKKNQPIGINAIRNADLFFWATVVLLIMLGGLWTYKQCARFLLCCRSSRIEVFDDDESYHTRAVIECTSNDIADEGLTLKDRGGDAKGVADITCLDQFLGDSSNDGIYLRD